MRLPAAEYTAELAKATDRRLYYHPQSPMGQQAVEILKWLVKRAAGRRDAVLRGGNPLLKHEPLGAPVVLDGGKRLPVDLLARLGPGLGVLLDLRVEQESDRLLLARALGVANSSCCAGGSCLTGRKNRRSAIA